MKFAVLLALIGLANCRTALIGGERAKDITLKYSFLDEYGREIDVKLEADKLGLGLLPAAPKPAVPPVRLLKAAPAPTLRSAPVFVVPPPAPEVRYAQVATQVVNPYVQTVVLPVTQYRAAAPAPTPVVQTRVAYVTRTNYVAIDDDDIDDEDDELPILRVIQPAVKEVSKPAVLLKTASLPAVPVSVSRIVQMSDDSGEEEK